MGLMDRLKHGWNAFINNRDPTSRKYSDIGTSFSYRPDRHRITSGNERTIVTSIFNKIALDVSNIEIRHVQLDDEGRFTDYVKSGLDDCLTTEANIDQTGRALKHDIVMSMFDEGVIAVVPVETSIDPTVTDSYDIHSLRVGKIVEWYPQHVKVRIYNERTGLREDVTLPKKAVAIIENPLYAVVNEPNSTMKRLIRKLSILDAIDEASGSGKLDMIIQLPYTVKSPTRKSQAEDRRKDIEEQLTGSKYGIAYIDATEKITQLNRPVENNLMKQIEYLTSMLYSQLGFHQSILDGTADEKTILNYNNGPIVAIVSTIVDEYRRKFLTKTARSQKKSIMYFMDPFKLMTPDQVAEVSDKLTRNEILSKNEIRQILGRKPSKDPKADQLINSNIAQPNNPPNPVPKQKEEPTSEITNKNNEGGKNQNGEV